MDVLFLHQNFPAQFVHLARAFKRMPACRPVAITDAVNRQPDIIPTLRYRLPPEAAGRPHPLAASFSARVARGERAARAMSALRHRGFMPSLVIGHLGWGETLFVKDVWPEAKLVVHAEYYYYAEGGDAGFDSEFEGEVPHDRAFSIRAKNAHSDGGGRRGLRRGAHALAGQPLSPAAAKEDRHPARGHRHGFRGAQARGAPSGSAR